MVEFRRLKEVLPTADYVRCLRGLALEIAKGFKGDECTAQSHFEFFSAELIALGDHNVNERVINELIRVEIHGEDYAVQLLASLIEKFPDHLVYEERFADLNSRIGAFLSAIAGYEHVSRINGHKLDAKIEAAKKLDKMRRIEAVTKTWSSVSIEMSHDEAASAIFSLTAFSGAV
jgi:hypothetical protein